MLAMTLGIQGHNSDRDNAELHSSHLLHVAAIYCQWNRMEELCNNHQGDQQGNNAIEHLAGTPNPSSEASATLEQETHSEVVIPHIDFAIIAS
jgi:hypothetical protein